MCDLAASTDPQAGKSVDFIDSESRTLTITPTDKTGENFRAKDMILQGERTY